MDPDLSPVITEVEDSEYQCMERSRSDIASLNMKDHMRKNVNNCKWLLKAYD
jgi:hypothetical protein